MSVYMGNKEGAKGRSHEEQQAEAWFQNFKVSRPVKVYADEESKERIKSEIFKGISLEIDRIKVKRLNILRVAAMLVLFSSVGLVLFKYRTSARPPQAYTTWSTFKATGKLPRLIVLADSSTVTLKSGSTLSVPSNFNSSNRVTKLLSGEAFFEVKRNPKKPFIVQLGKFNVKVLGTAFTVQDDKKLNRKVVAVAHGTVQVSNNAKVLSLLTKGQRMKFINTDQKFDLDKVTPSMVALWSQNQIDLSHASFADLTETFEAFYGKELVTNDRRIQESLFTLVINKKQQASAILKIIGKTHGLYFEEKDEKIILAYQK
jgi:transmembrane sensor